MKTKKYRCRHCEKTFLTLFEFQQHKNLLNGEAPFMCTLCNRHFPTVHDYVSHAMLHFERTKNDGANKSRPTQLTNEVLYSIKSSDLNVVKDKDDKFAPPLELQIARIPYVQAVPTYDNVAVDREAKQKPLRSASNEKIYAGDESKLKKMTGTGFYCRHCNVKFKSLKKYCQHNKKLHNFLCENCHNKYSSTEKLGKHVCFVSSNGEPFKCSCSVTFTKADDFKLHAGKRPYSCCSCSMQFNRVTNLIRHIRTHTKQKPYICKDCGRGFSQSTNLRNHASTHLGVKAVKCNECSFSCKTLSGLLKHKKKHSDGYMLQTVYIDKRKTSTGITNCPICQKEFPFKRNVGMHIKVHKKKESLCQECGKVFDTKSKLTSHYKACHGVPSICQTCGKTFASSVLLAAHEKIHVTGKSFSCSKCCKMFSIKNYLVQHMKTHSEGKQYSCNKCGKLFKVAVSLKYHSKICLSVNMF